MKFGKKNKNPLRWEIYTRRGFFENFAIFSTGLLHHSATQCGGGWAAATETRGENKKRKKKKTRRIRNEREVKGEKRREGKRRRKWKKVEEKRSGSFESTFSYSVSPIRNRRQRRAKETICLTLDSWK